MLKQTKRGKIYNSSSAPELKNKDNKIRFEVKVEDNEKIDQALKSVKHWNVQKHLEKLKDKEFLVKQLKLIIIAEREEDGWKVVKCYLSNNLFSNSFEFWWWKTIIYSTKRSSNKQQKEWSKKKRERKKQVVWEYPPSFKKPSKTFKRPYKRFSQLSNTNISKGLFLICGREEHFQYNCSIKAPEILDSYSGRDWKILLKKEHCFSSRYIKKNIGLSKIHLNSLYL